MKKVYNAEVFKNKEGEAKTVGTITKDELKSLKDKAESVDGLEEKLGNVTEELEAIKSKLGDINIEDLLKAKQELEDVKKAKEEKELSDMVEVVKGFNFTEAEEDIQEIAKFLNDNKGNAVELILTGIETMNDQKKAAVLGEKGSDLSNQEDSEQQDANIMGSAVTTILKNRGSIKN